MNLHGQEALAIDLFWGDRRIGRELVPPRPRATFKLAEGEPLGAEIQWSEEGFQLQLARGLRGSLLRGDERWQLDAEGSSVSLEQGDRVELQLGQLRAEAAFRPLPRRVLARWVDTVDYRFLNIALVAFFAGALFIVTALNEDTESGRALDDMSAAAPPSWVKLKLQVAPPPPPASASAATASSAPPAARERQGSAGHPDGPRVDRRWASKGNAERARDLVGQVFKGPGLRGLVSQGLGSELTQAMGHVQGKTVGDADGFGGVSTHGTGPGGGGLGDPRWLGSLGTGCKEHCGALGGSGVFLPKKESLGPDITSTPPVIQGPLDRELIRRVIRANQGQIRFCYESQLVRRPSLKGRVAVRFVITGEGHVATSEVSQADMPDSELERCMNTRILGWVFPKPRGGGISIVNYPFLFALGS